MFLRLLDYTARAVRMVSARLTAAAAAADAAKRSRKYHNSFTGGDVD